MTVTTPLDPLNEAELARHGAALRAVGRSLLGDSDADDLVQESWLAALQSSPRRLRSWLLGTVRKLALARRRSDLRRRSRETVVARRDDAPAAAEMAAQAEIARAVAAAVAALEEPYRSAIVLRFWQGLSAAEAAAQLGVPVATLRSQLQRGLVKVRARLTRDNGGRAAWAAPLTGLVEAAVSPTTPLVLMATAKTKVVLTLASVVALVAFAWMLAPESDGNAIATHVAASPVAASGAGNGSPVGKQEEMQRTVAEDGSLLRVQVVDEDDRPVPGVLVTAANRADCYRADADGEGRATLRVPGGTYNVAANYITWKDGVAQPRRRPDLSTESQDAAAGATPQDVRLVLAKLSCALRVQVVDDLGSPVPDVDVRIHRRERQEPETLRTDDNGNALFLALGPWNYSPELGRDSLAARALCEPMRRLSCNLTRGITGNIEYRLERMASVRFELKGVEGAEAQLQFNDLESKYSLSARGGLRTSKGVLTLPVPPGQYGVTALVDASAWGFAHEVVKFVVAAGEATVVAVPIERATGVLSVHIRDVHGAPVANAWVSVRPSSPPFWGKSTNVSEQGDYVVRGMPAAALRVFIHCRGIRDRDLAFLGMSFEQNWLEVAGPDADVQVVLVDAFTIRGRALDSAGHPLASGTVSCECWGPQWTERVDIGKDESGNAFSEPGTFELRRIPPGRFRMWIGVNFHEQPDAVVDVNADVATSRIVEVTLRQRAAAEKAK